VISVTLFIAPENGGVADLFLNESREVRVRKKMWHAAV